MVISDWGGAHDTEEAITNGLDLEFGTWTDGLTMGATNAYDNYYLAAPYRRLLAEGKYTTKELDDKVRRVLRLMFRTNMNRQRPYGSMCSEAHYETARNVAQEGIVLLKNNTAKEGGRVLPIPADARILVVGENAIKMMTVGGGSSSLKVQHEISPLQGMQERFSNVTYARGYVGDVTGNYNGVSTGQDLNDNRTPSELIAEAVEKAKAADYVVIFGGLNKADFQDCEGHDRKEYGLPYGQAAMWCMSTSRAMLLQCLGQSVCQPSCKDGSLALRQAMPLPMFSAEMSIPAASCLSHGTSGWKTLARMRWVLILECGARETRL